MTNTETTTTEHPTWGGSTEGLWETTDRFGVARLCTIDGGEIDGDDYRADCVWLQPWRDTEYGTISYGYGGVEAANIQRPTFDTLYDERERADEAAEFAADALYAAEVAAENANALVLSIEALMVEED